MIRRILLALSLAAFASEAIAANCTNPIGVKDQAATVMNFNTTVDGSNNCTSNMMPGAALSTLTLWDTGTAGATTQTVMSANAGAPAILLQLNQSAGSFAAGAITFQGTYDGTNWTAIPDAQLINPNTLLTAGTASGIYTLVTNVKKPFLILTQGYQGIRINLSTAITGTGTVTPFVTLLSTNPVIGALLNPIVGITPVSIDQTTPGTTNAVVDVPTSASGAALTQNACGSAVSSCVLKASAGNFYGAYANCTAACWMMVFNSTSAPSNGATTAGFAANNMVDCVAIPANDQRGVSYPILPVAMSTGITVAISSTACATLTLATTGFIHGTVK